MPQVTFLRLEGEEVGRLQKEEARLRGQLQEQGGELEALRAEVRPIGIVHLSPPVFMCAVGAHGGDLCMWVGGCWRLRVPFMQNVRPLHIHCISCRSRKLPLLCLCCPGWQMRVLGNVEELHKDTSTRAETLAAQVGAATVCTLLVHAPQLERDHPCAQNGVGHVPPCKP